MALSTKLPPNKRIFWIFFILAFALSTLIFQIAPQASEETLNQGSCKLDIAIVIGTSESMNQKMKADDAESLTRLQFAKNAAQKVIGYFDYQNRQRADAQKTQIALVSFAGTSSIDVPLSAADNLSAQYSKLAALQTAKGANLGNAIMNAHGQFKNDTRKGVQKVIMVFSDGRDNKSAVPYVDPIVEAAKAKASGDEIFAFGIGENGVLPYIASAGIPRHFQHNPTNGVMNDTIEAISNKACAQNQTSKPCKLDLAILLDATKSMNKPLESTNSADEHQATDLTRMAYAKAAAAKVATYFRDRNASDKIDDPTQTKIALSVFSSQDPQIDTLTSDISSVITKIGTAAAEQPTTDTTPATDSENDEATQVVNDRIAGAIAQARTTLTDGAGKRAKPRKVIVIISDSKDSTDRVMNQAKEAKQAGIEIYTISLGQSQDLMKSLASNPDTTYFRHQPKLEKLDSLLSSMQVQPCPVKPVVCKLDMVVALDTSASMNKTVRKTANSSPTPTPGETSEEKAAVVKRIDKAKEATKGLLSYFEDKNKIADSSLQTQIGLTTFAAKAKKETILSTDYEPIRTSLDGIKLTKDTNIGQAIQVSHTELIMNSKARPDAKKVLVIVSDGNDSVNSQPVKMANAAKKDGVEIYSIAVGTEGVMPKLNSNPDSTYYYYDKNGDTLVDIFQDIAINACPADLTVTASADKKVVRAGQTVTLSYVITNGSENVVRGVRLSQKLPDSFTTLDGKDTFTLDFGTIQKGATTPHLTAQVKAKEDVL